MGENGQKERERYFMNSPNGGEIIKSYLVMNGPFTQAHFSTESDWFINLGTNRREMAPLFYANQIQARNITIQSM